MNDIKLFAGYYVYFQENLSNSDKITFFNFIKEATDNQVECLLLTGKMISEEIIQEVDTVYSGWMDDMHAITKSFNGDTGSSSYTALTNMIVKTGKMGYKKGQTKGALIVGGIALAALATTLAFKVYKNYLSRAAKACQGKKGAEKQQCMRKVKMDARKQKIMSLTKAQSVCSKTKNPEKCVAKLKLKIAKEKAKMKKIKY